MKLLAPKYKQMAEVNNQIDFVCILTRGQELVEHFGVAVDARMQVYTLLVLQRIKDGLLDELLADGFFGALH